MLSFSHSKVRRIFAVCFVLIILSVISFYFNSFVETQTISSVDSSVEAMNIASDASVAQSFVAQYSRLSFIDVRIDAKMPMHMDIYDEQGEFVVRSTSAVVLKEQSDYVRFRFDQHLQTGNEYFFSIPGDVFSNQPNARIWGTHTTEQSADLNNNVSLVSETQHQYNTHVGYRQTHYGLYVSAVILTIICGLSIILIISPKFTHSKRLALFLLFLLPLISFIIVEVLNGQTFLAKSFQVYVLNYLLYALFYLVLFAAMNRFHISALFATVALFGLGVANHLKLGVRGEPLQIWDLFTVRTALNVSEHYSLPISAVLIISFLILFLVGSIVVRFRFSLQSKRRRLEVGLIGLALSVILFGFLMTQSEFEGKQDMVMTQSGIMNITWNPQANYSQNGLVVALAMNVQEVIVREPDNYDLERVEQVAQIVGRMHEFERIDNIRQLFFSNKIDDYSLTQTRIQPNIIVIMNESYADIQRIEYFETSQPILPNIDRLSDQMIRGDLYVSTYGGGTANSEFEFLTGHSMAFLPQGSVPYEQYIDVRAHALPLHLSDIGYDTVVIHPYIESGWNRMHVYDVFGFDEMFFEDDFIEAEMVRDYISDAQTYSFIIDLLENKRSEDPLFVFNVTMQNHGPYDYEAPFSKNNIYIQDFPGHFPETEQYLNLIHLSDEAISDLIEYLRDFEEPTILLFFGDHLPSMNNGFYDMLMDSDILDFSPQQMQNLYRTDYFFWANFELYGQENVDVSLNYLSVKLLEYAGLPLSDYHLFLRDLMQDYPVITPMGIIDNLGQRYDLHEFTDRRESRFEDYSFLIYNDLFDDARYDPLFDSSKDLTDE